MNVAFALLRAGRCLTLHCVEYCARKLIIAADLDFRRQFSILGIGAAALGLVDAYKKIEDSGDEPITQTKS